MTSSPNLSKLSDAGKDALILALMAHLAAAQQRIAALEAQPVARLRPTGRNDRVEVFYWPLWKGRWTSAGPFGRTILPLGDSVHCFRGHLLGSGITSGGYENVESLAQNFS